MLRANDFVVVISTDYSKAFDTVRHSSLADKLGRLHIPDHIFNWLMEYFKDRGHITRFANVLSRVAHINASVVQGSVVGPFSYIAGISDLHPIHCFNIQVKYADDSYLLVGSSQLHTALEEFEHITVWATKNKLQLNASKTKEIVFFKKRNRTKETIPQVIPGAERVETIKILGVTLRSDLGMETHLNNILAASFPICVKSSSLSRSHINIPIRCHKGD